jgi:signal transduction histidine kinase
VEFNNSHARKSLHRFLNQRYLAILVTLTAILVSVVLFMRHSAMDDTTDYYMQYDAQVLSEHYAVSDKIMEFDAGIKEYYWGTNQLPQAYKQLLGIAENQLNEIKNEPVLANESLPNELLNETNIYQLEQHVIYILPYFSEAKNEILFVVHIFDQQHEAMFYQAWLNSFILLVALCLAFVIFYSLHTNKSITRQMSDFHHYISTMSQFDYTQLQQHTLPVTIQFEELVNSATNLKASLLAQHEFQHSEQALLTREKHFLSSLSHELRTPIAITSAALTLLNNSENINATDKGKLLKLNNAHLKMKQLTQTLLQLWRSEQSSSVVSENIDGQYQIANKVFLLDELIEQAVTSCQQQFSRKNIQFVIEMDEHMRLYGQYELADILINNLLRNACQYTADGNIKLVLKNKALMVENRIAENAISAISDEATEISYGYGLGLFLAEKICQQCCWPLGVSSTDHVFRVEVSLNDANEDENNT